MGQTCAVAHIFVTDQRLVVGERQPDIAVWNMCPCLFHQIFGGHIHRMGRLVRHGNFAVLAEGTAHIAAVASGG
ncbi:hypothetical protein SDC9_91383 [bioreactor metagenome]|uniref:Uncharacterized protein n=1 Tax=bioreactor metagenome TaxID=1076179 RepID=A0A644ZV46_9ZZZZ